MMKPDLRNAVVRLVDDDLSIIKSASFILRQDGWQVRSWTSARDFLIEDMPSDVGCLVLDIRMPGPLISFRSRSIRRCFSALCAAR